MARLGLAIHEFRSARSGGCEQKGIEMGRPGLLHGFAEKRAGKVSPPHVSGRCMSVMQGTISI